MKFNKRFHTLFLLVTFLIISPLLGCIDNDEGPIWDSVPLNSQTIPGKSYYLNQYEDNGQTREDIVYIAGNLPIVISVPHGGYFQPDAIPNHNGTTAMDVNTQEIALALKESIYNLSGKYPHIVFNKLHRKKLDANRNGYINSGPKEITYNSNSDRAAIAFEDFHFFIDFAKNAAVDAFGDCLYIDLHGHGHSLQKIELGYLVTGKNLYDNPGDGINDFVISSSFNTLYNKLQSNGANIGLNELIRGENSIGSLLENSGFECIPSMLTPAPQPIFSDTVFEYYNGGFNVEYHCSDQYSHQSDLLVPGIQIELHRDLRNDNTKILAFSHAMANSLATFISEFFQINIIN